MTARRIALLVTGAGIAGCLAPEPIFLLEDQPPGATVTLNDADLWAASSIAARLSATFDETGGGALVAEVPGGNSVSLLPSPVGARGTLVTSTVLVPIPRAPAGVAEFPVILRRGTSELARWTVKRRVNDPELQVCVADQPAEVEDLAAPLTKCHLYTAEEVDREMTPLHYDETGAYVRKRVAFSTRVGGANVTVLDLVKLVGGERPRLLPVSEGQPVEVVVDPWVRVSAGSHSLFPRMVGKPSLVDLTPAPPTISVRIGSTFDLLREVRANGRPLELVSFDDELGPTVSLDSPLPLTIGTAANTALTVRLAPRGPGPHGLVRLGLRDPSGVVLTDRISFSVKELPAATCRLAIDDVSVGPIRVGERRMIDVAVRNVGTQPCTKARVVFDAEVPGGMDLSWPSGAMPDVGQTVMRRLGVEARSAGSQVRLMSVFFDELAPTQADLVVRIDAAPTP